MKLLTAFLLTSALILNIAINGCGKKQETPEVKKDESVTEQPQNQQPNNQTGTSEGNKEPAVENELGMKTGLPPNFPSEIPQPNNSKNLGHLNSSEGTVVTFESTDKVKDIVEFYKKEMEKKGYKMTEGGEMLVSESGGLMGWKKGDKEIGLMLGYDKDRNVSSVVITYK